MINFLLASLFGIATIACLFVLWIWYNALEGWRNPKLAVSASGMLIATAGVSMLCFNRSAEYFNGTNFVPWALFAGVILIVIGKTTWMIGGSMGSSRRPLIAFLLLSILWLGACVARFFG